MRLCFLLFLLVGVACYGTEKISHQYVQYSLKDGLPSSDVYCALQDKNGFLWFGTDAGVSKFDGLDFKNYSIKDGLTDNVIFHLYEDCLGRIWYMSDIGGIGYFKNDSIHAYQYNELLINSLQVGHKIVKLSVDSLDNMKFSTYPGGYGEIKSEGKLTLASENEYKRQEFVMSETPFSYFLIPFSRFTDTLFIRKEGELIPYPIPGETFSPWRIFHLSDSTVFFQIRLKETYGCFYLNKDSITYRTTLRQINEIYIDEENRLWECEFAEGVKIYENIAAFMQENQPQQVLFEELNVTDIIKDSNQSLWITSDNFGVYYIPNKKVKVKRFLKSIQQNKITALAKNSKEEVFYANEYGEIYQISIDGTHQLFYEGEKDINTLAVGKNDDLLVLRYSTKRPLIEADNERHIISGVSRSGVILDNGDLVYSIGSGLYHAKKSKGYKHNYSPSRITHCYSLILSKNGTVWAGTKAGLFRTQVKNEVETNLIEGTEGLLIKSIAELSDSVLLIASDQYGLTFWNKHEPFSLSTNIHLNNYVLNHIYVDNENDIWIASNNGIMYLRKSGNQYEIQNITDTDGLSTNEANEIVQAGNTIYIATNNGLCFFNKNFIDRKSVASKVQIQSVYINENRQQASTSYEFQYDQNYLEFRYLSLFYQDPKSVEYYYRLEGIDEHWQKTTRRRVRYPDLDPGVYAFRIKSLVDKSYSEEEIIHIKINPPYWKEAWFLWLITIISCLLILFIIRRAKIAYQKNRKLEDQAKKIIEVELKALRSQMNPHFTFNTLNNIQSYIADFDQENALKYITDFSILLRKILETSKSNLIQVSDEIQMLKLYTDLENMRVEKSIDITFDIDENIDQDYHEIPSMVIQPFVENAILHGLNPKAGERKLEIKMRLENQQIVCTIKDNGIGRKASSELNRRKKLNHESMGIQITKERLNFYFQTTGNKLHLEINDLYDKTGSALGTQVRLFL